MSDEYSIKKRDVTMFSARKTSDSIVIDYDFEYTDRGWVIRKKVFSAATDNVELTDIFIPAQLMEQVLLIESTKNELTDK